jgi:hypothetical protein
VTGDSLSQAVIVTTDGSGNFLSPDLASGIYSVRVTRDGFEASLQTVDLHGSAVQLDFKLTVAGERVSHHSSQTGERGGHRHDFCW